MKKLKIMIIFIIFCFSFFLLSYFKTRNYELKYEKDKYKITEKYIKTDKNYVINISYNKDNYTFIISDKYHRSRKLVNRVRKYENDDEICFKIRFNQKDISPVCKKNGEFVSYHLVSNKMSSKISIKNKNKTKENKSFEYKNIKVDTLNNKKILIWNYHGFYYLDNKNSKIIKISNKDIYNPSLVGQIDKYLIIPDYDQGYEHNNIKVLNVDNLKIENLKLNDSLSDESYVLGINDNSIFIFDKKYEKEFEIVPYKLKYRTINPKIYENGKIVNKTSTSLSNKEETFIYDTTYDYKIINEKLYRINKYTKEKTLLSKNKIKEIVKKDNTEIYYISDDKLYVYSDKYGEKKMLEYFELNFNYKNIIYIFD